MHKSMQCCLFFCILVFTKGSTRSEDHLLKMPDILELFFLFQF